ncbi:MAG: efflux RND transporter periplasmic adaptor subunit [Candidatus Omnitrophica bacterium]|nr:efflux RND transporter periplasmic adaptor subunit [Candidatus Omnitrophota bacterium]
MNKIFIERNKKASIKSLFGTLGVFILIMGLFVFSGCTRKSNSENKRPVIKNVTIQTLKISKFTKYYETAGTTKPEITSRISSRVMGTVTSVDFKEGQFVYAGQTLITLSNKDFLQKVRAAQKSVQEAKQNKILADVTYKRYKQLYDEKVITPQQMDEITTRKNVANMQYKQAESMLSYAKIYYGFTTISAPISGIVSKKNVEIGDMAMPGFPLLTIENTSSFKINANVDEKYLGKLNIGMPVYVSSDNERKKINGIITQIVPSIDPMTRTFLIKIQINNPVYLKSGLYVKIYIPVGKKKGILIPQKSIVRKGELIGVYTVNDKGIISYSLIRTGNRHKGQVEVLSGLNPGEKIIVNGIQKVVEGGIVQ